MGMVSDMRTREKKLRVDNVSRQVKVDSAINRIQGGNGAITSELIERELKDESLLAIKVREYYPSW